jgi:4-hydroxybenzoate polyprenyltransferase
MRQAHHRWFLAWTVSPILLYTFFGKWAALNFVNFQTLVTFFYVWPNFNHWICRNAFAAFAALPMLRIENAIISRSVPELNMAINPDFFLTLWLLFTIHLQEFHDVEGDRLMKRQTLPIILSARGIRNLRMATAAFLIGCSTVMLLWTMSCQGVRPDRFICWISLLQHSAAWNVASRTMYSTSAHMDEMTYRKHYYFSFFTIMANTMQLYFTGGNCE